MQTSVKQEKSPMRLAIIGTGTGSSLDGWKRAGFELAWAHEDDGVARRIQKANGYNSLFRFPQDEKATQAVVFLDRTTLGARERRLIEFENPLCFLVETTKALDLDAMPYSVLGIRLNSSRFYSAHARIRKYYFCLRSDLPSTALESVRERVIQACKFQCKGMRQVCPSVGEFVLMSPRRAGGRTVYNSLHPCPQVHSRSGQQPRHHRPHPCDSTTQGNARVLRQDQIVDILNLKGLKRPQSVSVSLFLKWCGKSMDEDLACLLGQCLSGLIPNVVAGAMRRPFYTGIYKDEARFRAGAVAFVTGAPELSVALQVAKRKGIKIINGSLVALTYIQGSRDDTDRVFVDLARVVSLPSGTVTTIKEHRNKSLEFDSVQWSLGDKIAKTRKQLLSILGEVNASSASL